MYEESFSRSLVHKLSALVPDKLYLSLKYYKNFGRFPNWKNPKTFTEKLQWLKLHNRKAEYTTMVDKYEVKKYVAGIIGERYIIPTLGVWDRAEDIDFDSLPDQFVLKATHDSGRVVICKDKAKLDKRKAIEDMKLSLQRDFYAVTREWPYKNVKRRIIAEQYMEDKSQAGDLADYKFFCFNGEPKYCQVIRDRSTVETIDFYDMEWNLMPFVGLNPVAQNGVTPVVRPENLDNMIRVCKELAKDNPFVRVDLYVINGEEYFGEITFYPASGCGVFTPKEWDTKLGELVNLKGVSGGGKKHIIITKESITKVIDTSLNDYKFFCFDGTPQFFKIDFGRFTDHHANYYDLHGNLLPFGEIGMEPKPDASIDMPFGLKEMVRLASLLSKGHPFLRVDFYEINGNVYFGELTFYPASGTGRFTDDTWDERIGSMLKLKVQ